VTDTLWRWQQSPHSIARVNLRRIALASSLVATLMANSVPAQAQTNEQRAAARAAAEAGADAYDAGKYEEAADLFTRAERLLHAPPHLLFAARSLVKVGRLVEAREFYLTLTRERLSEDAPRAFKDAVAAGNKELDEIEPRIAHVSVVVQGSGSNEVKVTRDSRPVPSELVGVPHPVDPGKHEYQAFSEGMESAPTTVTLKEGGRETVVLTLQPIPGWTKPVTPASTTSSAGTGTTSSGGDAQVDRSSGGASPWRIGAYVGFGVAAVGAGLGTYFLLDSNSTRKDADAREEECKRNNSCTLAVQKEIGGIDDEADDLRNKGVVSLVVGGVGLGAAITFLLVDPGRGGEASTGVRPVIGLGYAGIDGRF
jgi:hypothetical protein